MGKGPGECLQSLFCGGFLIFGKEFELNGNAGGSNGGCREDIGSRVLEFGRNLCGVGHAGFKFNKKAVSRGRVLSAAGGLLSRGRCGGLGRGSRRRSDSDLDGGSLTGCGARCISSPGGFGRFILRGHGSAVRMNGTGFSSRLRGGLGLRSGAGWGFDGSRGLGLARGQGSYGKESYSQPASP